MGDGYLLFVWTPRGYELRERDGEPPAAGSLVEEDGVKQHVAKLGASPLPNDHRVCAYLQAS